jgi:hypothetical protein
LFVTVAVLCGISLLAPASQASPPNNLAEAIKQSSDRDRRRIPLLILNAEQTRYSWRDNSFQRLHELYREENAKPPLADVLPIFRRQIVSCSSVQIVAPVNRITLNPYPGPPEEWARIGRERAARLLFTSLTRAQWATASSTNGIGLGDLQKKEQKAWFLSLIPEPFVLQEMEAAEGGGATSVTGTNNGPRSITLSPEQARVRVVRSMSWWYRRGPNSGYSSYGSGNENRQPGQRYWQEASQPEGQQTAESYRDRLKDVVRIEKPNRLQKGDLSFNGAPLFGKNISLAGAKTLGDLVQRVAEATNLEIYADRRLTGLPITIVGDENATADAADVMKALCLATTGTIRKVADLKKNESVYLLAGDYAPLMPTRLQLAEWAADVDSLLNAEQTAFQETVKKEGVVAGVGFAADAAGQISDAVMKAAEEQIVDPNRYQRNNSGFIPIPVNALPAAGQAKVRRDLERANEYSGGNQTPMDDKTVYAQFSVETQLLVPGYGSFDGPNLTSLETLLPRKPAQPAPPKSVPPTGPVTLPPALQQFAILKIAPKDDEELEAAAKWAKGRGFSGLFVRTSLWEDAEKERLSRSVAIGEKYGVKIYPTVSLLRVPPAESTQNDVAPHNLARARNIFGESLRQYALRRKDSPALSARTYEAAQIAPLREADWLDASEGTVQKTIAERIARIAKVPGIGGMVWEDVAAPGTAMAGYSYSSGSVAGRFAGFSDTLRVAFIRQENADPMDTPPYGSLEPYIDWSSGEVSPFLGNEWETRERFRQYPAYRKDPNGVWKAEKATSNDYDYASSAWNTLVRENNRAWIGAIRKVADLPPSLAVYIEAPGELAGGLTPWTTLWAPSDPLMPKAMGKEPLLPLTIRRESTPTSIRNGLSTQLVQRLGKGTTPAYSGLVIDVTAKPLGESLSLLSPLTPIAK